MKRRTKVEKLFFLQPKLSFEKGMIINMNNKSFKVYTRIRSLREDHDLTQKKIATILNMSQTGYSKYETGENDIPTRILINLSLYYDTSIDYLLGITDEQKPYTRSKNLENMDINGDR